MRIGILGAGRIGANAARLFAAAGHEVLVSFSRHPERLVALAREIGERAAAGTPAEAARFGEVVMVSVPWTLVDGALEQAGGLEGKVVVDTTNQFGPAGLEALPPGMTAAQYNAARMPGASVVKSFNALSAVFQAEAAHRVGDERVVMFMCGDDAAAKTLVHGLIHDAGFVAVDMGGLAGAGPMEPPRRAGAVYGEEYHLADAIAFVEALKSEAECSSTLDRGER